MRQPAAGVDFRGHVHHSFDLGRMEEGVVDQAGLHRPQDAGLVARIQGRHGHLNPEASQPRRLRGFLRGHLDLQTVGRQRPGFEVLRGVEPGAATPKGNEIIAPRGSILDSEFRIPRHGSNDSTENAPKPRVLPNPELQTPNLEPKNPTPTPQNP